MMLATTAQTSPYTMPSPAEGVISERAIVIAAQRGSDDAFSALVRIHQRRAYAIVRAIVLSHEDAEDAVQEGFLHAHPARARPVSPRPAIRGVALPDHGECRARPRASPKGAPRGRAPGDDPDAVPRS